MQPLLWWLPQFGSMSGGAPPAATMPPLVFSVTPRPCFCTPFYSDPYGDVVPVWYSDGCRTRFPIGNVALTELDKFARTLDLDPANTQADVYFGEACDPKAFAMLSNLSDTGTYVLTFATSRDNLTEDPLLVTDALPAIRAGVTKRQRVGLNVAQRHVLSDNNAALVEGALWARIAISDPANPAGYLELYRCAFTGRYTPTRGISVGAQIRPVDRSVSVMSAGGSVSFNRFPKWREFDFVIKRIDEAEAFTTVWDICFALGITEPLFFCWDRDDPLDWKRDAFVRIRALDGVEWPYATATQTKWQLQEVL